MSRVNDNALGNIMSKLKQAVYNNQVDPEVLISDNYKPTHVIDIYKMRRGRYRGVRIWTHIHLGTGYRKDLFMTSINGEIINWRTTAYITMSEEPVKDWMAL